MSTLMKRGFEGSRKNDSSPRRLQELRQLSGDFEAGADSLLEFFGEHFVGGGAGAVFIVVDDWFAETRSFRETGGAGNQGFTDQVAEMLSDFVDDLGGETRAAVEHCHHHAKNFEVRVDARIAELTNDAVDHRNAFERVVFALEGNEQPIGGRKNIQRENAKRRRAIDHDQVVFTGIDDGSERILESEKMIFQTREFDFRAAHIDFARHEGKALVSGGLNFLRKRCFAEQGSVSAGALAFFEADAAGGVRLGIEIEQENALAVCRQAGGDVDAGRCFPHAAFLIGDCDYFRGHAIIVWRRPDLLRRWRE